MFKLLLIEDDASLAEIILFNLKNMGHQVDHLNNGQDALNHLQKQHYDLVLLDVMLPGASGLEICQFLRQQQPQVHILMLTSLNSEADRVVGLEMGADDYLVKPFSLRELQARVNAQIRRITPSVSKTELILNIGPLSIDPLSHQVTLDQTKIDLTVKEFDLLFYLAKQPGRVFTREQLLQQVWDYQYPGYEHTVNTHINRLRKKLEPFNLVQTVWGVGYKFEQLEAAHA